MTFSRVFRRGICAILAVVLLFGSIAVSAAEPLLYEFPVTEAEDGTVSEAIESPSAMMLYIGMQPEQDVVLYEKQADVRYQPGALMRVAMTGYAMKLITEQHIDIDTTTATYTLELFNRYVAGSGLHTALMNFGETWTLRDLLTMCSIQTVADCAVTLAAKLAGTPETFVEGLNAFAAELGCENSHFTNVGGTNEEGQYMSARDAVTFVRYAMQYPELADMLELTDWTVQPVEGGDRRSWPTSNDMIRPSTPSYYTYANGGRTGATEEQMHLIEYGSMNGYDYMAVVMGAPRKDKDNKLTRIAYADARRLIRWGLLDFQYVTLLHKDEPVGRAPVSGCAERDYLSLVPAADFNTVVGKDVDVTQITREISYNKTTYTAPVARGESLGTMTLYLDGRVVGQVPLVAGEAAPHSVFKSAWEGLRRGLFSGWALVFVITLFLLIALYIWFAVRYNRERQKARKR